MSGRVEWADVLAGRGYRAQPLNGRTEEEQRELRAEFERRMDAADEGLPLSEHWRKKRDELAKLTAEVAQRGTWVGTGLTGCPQCRYETEHGAHIDVVDHDHWVADKRLEQRLLDHAKIARAEADGGIRSGSTYQDRPLDEYAAQMVAIQRERVAEARLRDVNNTLPPSSRVF